MKVSKIAAWGTLGAFFLILLPIPAAAESWPWLRLWPSGKYRDQGEVIATGEPGKDMFIRTGHWTFWYRSGQIREEGGYTRGVKTGEWRSWYQNWIRRQKGSHDHEGRKTGNWEYWYENGLPSAQGSYRGDVKDGSWCYWYNRPDKKQKEGSYRDSLPDGFWTYWYENGFKEREGTFARGQEEGHWDYWFPDGELKCSGNYWDGLEIGLWTYREKAGEEYLSWTYDYAETEASESGRDVRTPSQALVGHWRAEKELSDSENSVRLPTNPHHIFFHPDKSFIEVLEGRLKNADYVVEDEDIENRTVLVRFEGEDGKGAVLFGFFSQDYRRLAGRYYLVDFLRGSRGRLINYFSASYVGTNLGPVAPALEDR